MSTPALRQDERQSAAWLTTALVATAFTLSYVDRQILSLLVTPIKASLALSDGQLGVLQGLSFSLFYVVAALPLARIADRGNRPRMISWCMVAWSLMTCACGLAGNFWQLLAGRVGVAVGEAGLPPAALTLMADLHDRRGLARATSIFMLAPFVGGGIALIGGGAIYAASAGWAMPVLPGVGAIERWQLLFLLVGLPGFLLAPLLALWLAEPRRTMPDGRPAEEASSRELVRFLLGGWRFSIMFVVAISLMVAMLNAQIAWLPAALARAHGLDEAALGASFGTIYLVSGVGGTLFAGWVAGRAAGPGMLRAVLRAMRAGAALLLLPAILATLFADLRLSLALIALAVFFTSAVVSMGSIPFQLTAPKRLRAQVLAVAALASALLGTGLGPLAVGLLSDLLARSGVAASLGWALSLFAMLVVPVVIALFSVVLRQPAAAQEAHR